MVDSIPACHEAYESHPTPPDKYTLHNTILHRNPRLISVTEISCRILNERKECGSYGKACMVGRFYEYGVMTYKIKECIRKRKEGTSVKRL